MSNCFTFSDRSTRGARGSLKGFALITNPLYGELMLSIGIQIAHARWQSSDESSSFGANGHRAASVGMLLLCLLDESGQDREMECDRTHPELWGHLTPEGAT